MLVTFGKFSRPSRGNDCDGKEILDASGKVVGAIYREIRWIDTGVVSSSYTRFLVTGYRLEVWGTSEDGSYIEDRTFEALSDATKAAREYFASK